MTFPMRWPVMAGLCLMVAPAQADSIWGEFDTVGSTTVPLADESDQFAGRAQLGYIASRGNTDTTNLNGKLVLGWDRPDWRHGAVVNAIYSKDAETTTARNYRAGYKADRKLGEQNYLFLALNWETNEFAGFDRRTSEAIGYGRRLFQSDRQRLDLEIGVGGRQTDRTDGTEQDENIGRLALSYFLDFGESSDFSHQMAVEAGDFNTYVESVTSISSQLVGELDLVASFTAKRNSNVPVGREKLDSYTTISLQYSF